MKDTIIPESVKKVLKRKRERNEISKNDSINYISLYRKRESIVDSKRLNIELHQTLIKLDSIGDGRLKKLFNPDELQMIMDLAAKNSNKNSQEGSLVDQENESTGSKHYVWHSFSDPIILNNNWIITYHRKATKHNMTAELLIHSIDPKENKIIFQKAIFLSRT